MEMRRPPLKIHDPGHFSLKRATRAAIVMPAVFAFADQVIQDSDTTLFAAFGSIALLVFTDFGGPWRRRLAAYLGLAVVGVGLISLGTLCSQTPWLAVAAMAVVGFAILLSGAISAYFAAAGVAALLLFVIPVAFPGPPSAIPARLEGWALAASAGICAVMLLWPAHPRDRLRAAAARASGALADLLDAELSGNRAALATGRDTAGAAVGDLRRSFVATPYRPGGPSGSSEALAFLVDLFEWLLSVVSATAGRIESRSEPCRDENREVMAASVEVLRASEANLDGERRQPDFDRLERAREAVARSLVQEVTDLPRAQEGVALPTLLEPTFRMRELSFAAREVGLNSLLASGGVAPGSEGAALRTRSALRAGGRLLLEQASPRSPLFRNSLRGAAGLALAVLVIELASLQNAFWVALATLSVLRSSALGTGSTIVSALAGTTVGIVVGGLLVYAIGTDETVLWVALPPAVLLAAYAPRAISFAAGQAGFTIVLMIIFNLIAPSGWMVGLVRVEDVAIGCAISLVVGVLFWPRGVEKLLRTSLGAAYARSADYVASAAERLSGAAGTPPTESALASARAAARGAAHRLDDAQRQYLTERGARPANIDSVLTLVAGATRVRLAAYSLSTLTPAPTTGPRLDACADALGTDVYALRSWYFSLSAALVDRTAISPTHPRNGPDGVEVVRCVSRAFAAGDEGVVGPALNLLWASQHLDNLRELGAQLTEAAAELS